jgi:hypothetical protein
MTLNGAKHLVNLIDQVILNYNSTETCENESPGQCSFLFNA